MAERNPILIGQAEEIDLVQAQVRAMIDNPGIYVGADSRFPGVLVPLVSNEGKVFSIALDEELDPTRFLPTLTLAGPYREDDRWRPMGIAWGAGQPRRRTSPANWKLPLRWNREQFFECTACRWRGPEGGLRGAACPDCWAFSVREARRRVFCASLADVFDNEVDPDWRRDLFELILRTPNLDWLLLTKRIGNVLGMLEQLKGMARYHEEWAQVSRWLGGEPPANVWLGATICNQAEADRDIPKLLQVPAAVRFLSMEPLLGTVDLRLVNLATEDDGPLDDISDEPLTDAGRGLDWAIAAGALEITRHDLAEKLRERRVGGSQPDPRREGCPG